MLPPQEASTPCLSLSDSSLSLSTPNPEAMRPCSPIPFLASISLLLSTVHSSSDGRGSRRVLHEPLFPIQWTPPPPPPDFSDPPPAPAGPFFPDSPPTGQTPTAANVSIPSPPSNPRSTATKNIAIGVSVALAASAILFFSAFLLYRRRIGRPPDSAKLIIGEDGSARRFRNPGRPAASASEFLYLGTMEPASRRVSGELNGSPYRKLSSERVVEAHYPSPELQPLPPLGGPPPPPPRRGVVPPPVGSSDDETFYTPHRSVASITSESPSSPVSRRSLPSVGSGGKEVLVLTVDSAPPRSRRTSPRRQLSNGSASEVKQMIPPVTRQPPQPPPPPPPPPPPTPPPPPPPKAEKIAATRPPQPPRPPPHPAGRNKPSSQDPAAPEPAELSQRRRLLKPLPPEGARINLPASVSKFSNGDGCSSSQPDDRTGKSIEGEAKPRLKPLHWDRVKASSDRPMVWDQLKSSSFQ